MPIAVQRPEAADAAEPLDAETLRARTAALFSEHGRFVWRVLRRLGVTDADIEDVCQDVFLTAHCRLGAFEQRSSSRTWIYGICLKIASNYRRRSYRKRERAIDALPESAAEQPLEPDERLADLDDALSQLSEAKREVFVLYEFGELSMAEVAEVVGSPLKTCFSRLHAARRELRESLERAGRSER